MKKVILVGHKHFITPYTEEMLLKKFPQSQFMFFNLTFSSNLEHFKKLNDFASEMQANAIVILDPYKLPPKGQRFSTKAYLLGKILLPKFQRTFLIKI